MKNKEKEEVVAGKLVRRALEIAVEPYEARGLTLSAVTAREPGRGRRSIHDDTTAVVMYF